MRDERPRFSRDSFSRITALRSHRSSPRRFPSVPKTADRRAAFQAARLAAAAALRSLRGDWLGLQARALCSWMSGFAAPGEDSDSPQLDEAVGEPVGKGVSVAFWRKGDNVRVGAAPVAATRVSRARIFTGRGSSPEAGRRSSSRKQSQNRQRAAGLPGEPGKLGSFRTDPGLRPPGDGRSGPSLQKKVRPHGPQGLPPGVTSTS